MISYTFTATVSPKFSRVAELLALADKYCNDPLDRTMTGPRLTTTTLHYAREGRENQVVVD